MNLLMSLFGAPAINFEHAERLSDSAPEIIMWAAPFMLFFVLLEWYISHRQHKHIYTKAETVASTCVGIANVIISFGLKFALFCGAILLYNVLPWRMAFNWWTLIPCYIILDFCSYWSHRISHQQRFFWATHVVHHSGEDYNLSVSFRLSWVQHIKIIFFLPVALCGFHPVIFFVANQIAVLFQFWVHTEYIKKLPRFIEYIFATPSNHRVHHGSQEKYINKNYGATFIIWDRRFGTYQAEEEQGQYGLTHNNKHKADPFHINYQEYADMMRAVRNGTGWPKQLFNIY